MNDQKFITYSQNFLKDSNLVDKLIRKTNITKNDLVLDIGAGEGIISKVLSKYAKKVVAIEIDKSLISALERSLENLKNIEILNIDFLDYELPTKQYKVFSNIPFNYSSRILKKLLSSKTHSPVSSHLFLQNDFWARYFGIDKESQTSLLIKPFYDIKFVSNVDRTMFVPAPAVDVVFVEIQKKDLFDIDLSEEESYRDFIVYATTQGRANLSKNLKNVITWKQFKILAKNLGFRLHDNPLDLSYKQWIELYRFYNTNVSDDKKRFVKGCYKQQMLIDEKTDKIYKSRIIP